MRVMTRPLTFILAGGRDKRFSPLISGRATPLVPFGGVFQLIDFTLSNCVNSSVDRAFLLTHSRADSIKQYVESSSWKTDLVCLQSSSLNGYRGPADTVYQNLSLLRSEKAEYVLILAADQICKMDYDNLIRFHVSHGGDVTVAAVQHPRWFARELEILQVNEQGQVVGFEEKPERFRAVPRDSSKVLANMGAYVFNASTLYKALLRDAGNFGGSHEFGRDVLPALIPSERVFAYDVNAGDCGSGSYWGDVSTLDGYHRAQMELLLPDPTLDLHDGRWPIYCGGRPAPFRGRESGARFALDSIISPDSEVGGATILQSVISPMVQVAPEARVEASVLMRGARVGRGAWIRRAIIGEGIAIPSGVRIGSDSADDHRRFHVTERGVSVVYEANISRIQNSNSGARILRQS